MVPFVDALTAQQVVNHPRAGWTARGEQLALSLVVPGGVMDTRASKRANVSRSVMIEEEEEQPEDVDEEQGDEEEVEYADEQGVDDGEEQDPQDEDQDPQDEDQDQEFEADVEQAESAPSLRRSPIKVCGRITSAWRDRQTS
jgi:hypothetical protein